MRNISIWKADDDTYFKFRILCIGKGLSTAEILKELVDKAYDADTTLPSKKQTRLMKRFVRRFK